MLVEEDLFPSLRRDGWSSGQLWGRGAEGEVKKMGSVDTDGALRRGGALALWQVGNQAALLDLRAEGL